MTTFEVCRRAFGANASEVLRIPVTTTAEGYQLELTAHVLTGSHPGENVGIVATHHGDEVFTVELLRRIYHSVKDNVVRGAVVIVPVLNPIAFGSGTRHTPLDMQNLNRVFPGNPDGWLTEILAHRISETILPGLDVLLDYQSGDANDSILYTYTEAPRDPVSRKVHELAKLMGAPILWETAPTPGNLRGCARALGIAAVEPEIGGSTTLNEETLKRGVKGCHNVLKHLGVLAGDPDPTPVAHVVREATELRPHVGGLWIPEVGLERLGGCVPGGTVLARVVSPYTFEELEVLRAPYPTTAMLMIRDRISKVQPGDYAYILGSVEDNHDDPAA
jgi:predicted deacylase